MKSAIQADYYVKRDGIENAFKKIRSIGYEDVYYTLKNRYDSPFVSQWGEEEMEKEFAVLAASLRESGLTLRYLAVENPLYNDHKPETFEARIRLYTQAAILARILGAKNLVVKPVAFYKFRATFREDSEAYTYEAFDRIYAECQKQGVGLVIANNMPNYPSQCPYGCVGAELMALAQRYDAQIIINPTAAFKAGKEIPALLETCGDRLSAFVINDLEAGLASPVMPMMGALDYGSIAQALATASQEAYAIMMMEGFVGRFARFTNCPELDRALEEFLFEMTAVIGGRQ